LRHSLANCPRRGHDEVTTPPPQCRWERAPRQILEPLLVRSPSLLGGPLIRDAPTQFPHARERPRRGSRCRAPRLPIPSSLTALPLPVDGGSDSAIDEASGAPPCRVEPGLWRNQGAAGADHTPRCAGRDVGTLS